METGPVADGAQHDAPVDARLADALKALFSQLEDLRSVHALASCCRTARAAWQQVRHGWMLRSVHKQRFFVRCAQQGDLPGLLHFLEGCDHGCLKPVLEEAVFAAAGSSLPCLQALQAHGAPVTSSRDEGHALQAAASAGNAAAVQYLLVHGAPDATAISSALIQAVAAGATPCAQLLLEASAGAAAVNVATAATAAAAGAGGHGHVGASNSTAASPPQHTAGVPAGHLLAVAASAPVETASMVQLLLRQCQLQQEELSCAMVQAAGLGHANICTTLVQAGAYAPEALAAAAAGGHLELLQGLLQWLPWEQHSKDLALVAAVQHGCLEAGRLMVSWGATACGAFTIAGPDLLHSAVSCDSVQLLLLLMGAASGVPPELCCYYMHCALRTAVAQGNALVVRHLLTLGAPCVAPRPPVLTAPASTQLDINSSSETATTAAAAAAGGSSAGAVEQQQVSPDGEQPLPCKAAAADDIGRCSSEPLLSPAALAALEVQMVLPPPGVSISPRDTVQLTSPTAASPTSPAQPSPTRPRPPTELHKGPVSPRSAKLRRRGSKGNSQSPVGKDTAGGGSPRGSSGSGCAGSPRGGSGSAGAGSPRGGSGSGCGSSPRGAEAAHTAAEEQAGAAVKDSPPAASSSSPPMRVGSAGSGRGLPAAAAAVAAAAQPSQPRRSRCLPPPLFTALEDGYGPWGPGGSSGGGEAGGVSHGAAAAAAIALGLGSPSSVCSADSAGAGLGLCSSTSGLTSDEDVLVTHSHSQACTEDLGDLLAATSLTPLGSDAPADGVRKRVSFEAPLDSKECGASPQSSPHTPPLRSAAGGSVAPHFSPAPTAAAGGSMAELGGCLDAPMASPSGLADALPHLGACASDQEGQPVSKSATQQQQQQQQQQGLGEELGTGQLLQQEDNLYGQQHQPDQDCSLSRKPPPPPQQQQQHQQQGGQLVSGQDADAAGPASSSLPHGMWPAGGTSSSRHQQIRAGLPSAVQQQHHVGPEQPTWLVGAGVAAVASNSIGAGPDGCRPCQNGLPAAAVAGLPPWIGSVAPASPLPGSPAAAAAGSCGGGDAAEGETPAGAVAAPAQLPELAAPADMHTPLLVVAARAGAPAVMQLLLQQPSSTQEQCAALGEAIQAGHYAVASLLLTEVNFNHQVVLDALQTAIAIHNRPMVQLLMQHGADVAAAARMLDRAAADQLLMAAAQFADTVVLPGVLRSCQYTREGLVAVVQHGLTDAVATLAEHLEPDVLVAMLVEAVLPPDVAAEVAPSAGLASSRPSTPAPTAAEGPAGDNSGSVWGAPPASPPTAADAMVVHGGGVTAAQREAAMQAAAAAMPALLSRVTHAALHVRDWLAFMRVFEYLCDSPAGPLLQTRLQGLERITTAALDRHFTALVPYFDTCLIPWLQPRLVDQAQSLVSCGAIPHQGYVHDLLVSCCQSLLLGQVQLLRRGGLVIAPAWQARVYAEVLLEARIIRRQLLPCDNAGDQLALGIARELSGAGVRGLGALQFSSCGRAGGLDRRQGDPVSQQILQMLAGRSRLMR